MLFTFTNLWFVQIRFLGCLKDDLLALRRLRLTPLKSTRYIDGVKFKYQIWDDDMMHPNVAYRHARTAFLWSNTLRAIMIGDMAWRLSRPKPFVDTTPKPPKWKYPIPLEALSKDEIEAIELFNISRKPCLSGIPVVSSF